LSLSPLSSPPAGCSQTRCVRYAPGAGAPSAPAGCFAHDARAGRERVCGVSLIRHTLRCAAFRRDVQGETKKRECMRRGFTPAPPIRIAQAPLGLEVRRRLRRTAKFSGGRRTTPPPPFSRRPPQSPHPLSPPPFFPSRQTSAGGDQGGYALRRRAVRDRRKPRLSSSAEGELGAGERGRWGCSSRPATLGRAAQPLLTSPQAERRLSDPHSGVRGRSLGRSPCACVLSPRALTQCIRTSRTTPGGGRL
jgi:hypothetical protein